MHICVIMELEFSVNFQWKKFHGIYKIYGLWKRVHYIITTCKAGLTSSFLGSETIMIFCHLIFHYVRPYTSWSDIMVTLTVHQTYTAQSFRLPPYSLIWQYVTPRIHELCAVIMNSWSDHTSSLSDKCDVWPDKCLITDHYNCSVGICCFHAMHYHIAG